MHYQDRMRAIWYSRPAGRRAELLVMRFSGHINGESDYAVRRQCLYFTCHYFNFPMLQLWDVCDAYESMHD